jgi:hypothetical protein
MIHSSLKGFRSKKPEVNCDHLVVRKGGLPPLVAPDSSVKCTEYPEQISVDQRFLANIQPEDLFSIQVHSPLAGYFCFFHLHLGLASQRALINLKCAIGHARHAVMLAHFLKAALSQFLRECWIAIDSQNSFG